MHVVIAAAGFGDVLDSAATGEALALGWREGAPHDTVDVVRLSGGGPGFLDAVADAVVGRELAVTVRDPLGRPVPAVILVDEASGTAYIEAAQATGLHLLRATERDPAVTTSFGLGELLMAARATGAIRIVIGVDGAGTNDGGAGMLCALGAGPPEYLDRGGLAAGGVDCERLARLPEVVADFADLDLVIATGDPLPLLGLDGANAVSAVERGASAQGAQLLEAALGAFSSVCERLVPARVDLLAGGIKPRARLAGSGSGGGNGYGLALLGARVASGIELLMELSGFGDAVAGADLAVTAEGVLHWAGLTGGTVVAVAGAGLAHGVPVIAVVGASEVGRREAMSHGLSSVYPLVDSIYDLDPIWLDPVGALRRRAARLARTWSPPSKPA